MGGCTFTASLAHKARTTPTARSFQLSHLLSAAHLFQFAAIHAWTLKSSFQAGILLPLDGRKGAGGGKYKSGGASRRVDCLWLFSSLLPRMRQRLKRQTSKQIPSSRETFGWWCCESGKNPGGRNGMGRSGAGRRALTAAAALRRSLQQRAWEWRTTRSQPPMLPLGPWGPSALQAGWMEPRNAPRDSPPTPCLKPLPAGPPLPGGGRGTGRLTWLWPEALLPHLHGQHSWEPSEPTGPAPAASVQAGWIHQPCSAVPVGRQAQVAFSGQSGSVPGCLRHSWALPGSWLPSNGKASSNLPATDPSCGPRAGTARQARRREREHKPGACMSPSHLSLHLVLGSCFKLHTR